ncbi:MAG: exo-alpha-sialidase [Thermoguttaceae bacterium]|nr:exo-alpha-sialidase [Thermoguttaceae bacterium]
MRKLGIGLIGAAACLAAVGVFSLGAAFGQDGAAVPLAIESAQTPIVIASDGSVRATKVQALDLTNVSGEVGEVVVTLSDPKYLLGLTAKVGDVEVGRYDFNGIFDVDANTPTKATQIPVQLDSALVASAREKSQELSIWTEPSSFASPELKVAVGVKSVTVGGVKSRIDAAPVEYRFGVLVRDSGWDGVAQYRIPALGYTKKGTLIAVYDARHNGFPDLPADIDVMCSRSFDGGKTWTKMAPVIDMKGEDEKLEGVGDPCILVDDETGRVWVAALWAHGGYSTEKSEPGLKLGTSGQLVIAYSDDDGATWSEPRNLTAELREGRDWRILFQGPGNGIVTRDGKLVLPAQFIDKDKKFCSTLMWSADKGETWTVGTGARDYTCECQVVELNDGALMLNMRNYSSDPKLRMRSVAITRDLGKTWTEDASSLKALPCPICQASVIRVKSVKDGDDKNLLAFMNPNSQNRRNFMTLKLSEDEGQTWPRSIMLYAPDGCGYSALAKIDGDTVGALYETSGGLMYQTVKLSDAK